MIAWARARRFQPECLGYKLSYKRRTAWRRGDSLAAPFQLAPGGSAAGQRHADSLITIHVIRSHVAEQRK